MYWNLGQVHLAMGAVEAAHEVLREGLRHSRATGYEAHVGQILNEMVRVHVRLGDVDRAEATAREALEVAERTGDKWLETSVRAARGTSAAAAGWKREGKREAGPLTLSRHPVGGRRPLDACGTTPAVRGSARARPA